MTITARQTSTRIRAIATLVAKLDALPLAVGEIHRQIEDGTIGQRDDRPRAENARGVQVSGHSDPTAGAALKSIADGQRELDTIERQMRDLSAAAGQLCNVVTRWVVSAANREEHPRCSGGSTVDEWTRPDCTNYVDYQIRADGTYSYRQDGLCTACRSAKYRWEQRANDAA